MASHPGSNTQIAHPPATENPLHETPSHDSIKWEPYPHLTEQLLEWLWDNEADRAILFNEKVQGTRTGTSATTKIGLRRNKKDIKTAIAKAIFEENATYGAMYAAQPDKFATAVSSRLDTYVSPGWFVISFYTDFSTG